VKSVPALIIALVLGGCVSNLPMQTSGPVDAAAGTTNTHLFHSAALAANLVIEIAPPQTRPATAPIIIYTLGGAATFALVAATARYLAAHDEVPPTIVVGIHTDTLPGLTTDALTRFITGELNRFVMSEYGADAERNILVGYGKDGTTVLAAMFDLPSRFAGYLIAAPAVADNGPFDAEAAYAKTHTDLPARVFFAVGGLETDQASGSAVAAVTAMTNHIRRRGYPGLRNETVIFAGEDQVSVLPAALSRGLRFLLR
jgi:enterochelin esterase-like enzyme